MSLGDILNVILEILLDKKKDYENLVRKELKTKNDKTCPLYVQIQYAKRRTSR